MVKTPAKRSRFGNVRRLPSGRWQARYVGPDRLTHTAPVTFDAKGDALTYLSTVRADIVRNTWKPASTDAPITFSEFAESWLTHRDWS